MLRRVAELVRPVSIWWRCWPCPTRVHRRMTTNMPLHWPTRARPSPARRTTLDLLAVALGGGDVAGWAAQIAAAAADVS